MSGGLRKLLDDGKLYTAAAVVTVLDGEAAHYHVNEEGDVVVSCLLHHGGGAVWANLGAIVGTRGRGLWAIPDPGVEVMLASDRGDIEGEVYLVACFPSGRTPTDLAPGVIVITGETVLVHDGAGGAEKSLKGETFMSAMDSLATGISTAFSAISTAFAALSTYAVAIEVKTDTGPSFPITTTLVAAMVAIETAMSSASTAVAAFQAQEASYMATVLKAK